MNGKKKKKKKAAAKREDIRRRKWPETRRNTRPIHCCLIIV